MGLHSVLTASAREIARLNRFSQGIYVSNDVSLRIESLQKIISEHYEGDRGNIWFSRGGWIILAATESLKKLVDQKKLRIDGWDILGNGFSVLKKNFLSSI